jgi:hypothetical protein
LGFAQQHERDRANLRFHLSNRKGPAKDDRESRINENYGWTSGGLFRTSVLWHREPSLPTADDAADRKY